VRILGALAKVAPHLVGLQAMEQAIREQWQDEIKVASAHKAYERLEVSSVGANEGNPEEPFEFELPGWQEMEEGLVIPGIRLREEHVKGWEGGYRPGRNPYFKKFSTRSMRPVVDFDKCTKCTLCWLQCPDSCFDITPDGFYDANMEACCGCGVCEAVCPVDLCITMVNEAAFEDNASQWEMWQRDQEAYNAWVAEKITHRPERSHGFHHIGQYQEEIAHESR
jgi:pyruvate ferredoxin oxidoreductase delta subunit